MQNEYKNQIIIRALEKQENPQRQHNEDSEIKIFYHMSKEQK